MSQRARKFQAVVEALGPLAVGPSIPGEGWPGLCAIQVSDNTFNVALHVASVSPHARRPYEMRFQNPAADDRPAVSDNSGTALPILLGVDEQQDPNVYIAVDGRSRLGRATRFSILFHKRIIDEARVKGWAVYVSNTGEKIYAFVPAMLPSFIAQILGDEDLPADQVSEAAVASGVIDSGIDRDLAALAAMRVTKAVNILVRKAGVGRRIREAYSNCCAMCGLGSNMLQGAHIYPVEAPGSNDEVWNGLSLCYNHHRAFDLHMIWIDPRSGDIHLHPSLVEEARNNQGARHFVESTWRRLSLPARRSDRPDSRMFERRYSYFEGEYEWVS